MGQSATELKQEIAQTRQNLGETLDAIGDRVSPGRMVERRKNRMARGFQNVRDRVIEIGLVADGRLTRFTVSISDRPGGLARLAQVIASTGASVKEIVHDRAFSGPDLSEVRVVCVVETTGHDHVLQLHRALADANVTIVA